MPDYSLSAKIGGDAKGLKKAASEAKEAIEDVKEEAESVKDSTSKVSDTSANDVKRSLNQIAQGSGKTVNQLRSEIMTAASEYKKQGMSMSEAMKKAYEEAGTSSKTSTDKSKSNISGLGNAVKSCASTAKAAIDGMKNKLNSFAEKTAEVKKKMQELGSSIKSVGDKMTKNVTKPAVAAATALAGVTLTKGFTRLNAIDTAKAKLEALGNSAGTVTDIMASATASVKGTAYGLDEAATTAASAVAAGIKPGEDLTRYLSLTADAAATAGRSMADMGAVFNKVQTSQAAYTEELNQLADSGIPIYQWLGEEAGLSAAEVKEMASKGQISSEMFLEAIEKNIGGAAKIVGEKSFSGALSNIWASIGRIGANFLDANGSGQGFFTQLKPLMVDFKGWLGTLEEKAKVWGQVFGEVFSGIISYIKTGKVDMQGFTDKSSEIITKLQPVIDVVKRIAGAFSELSPKIKVGLAGGIVASGPLISILGTVISKFGSVIGIVGKLAPVLGGLCSPIGLIVAALAALGVGFGYVMANNEEFRNDFLGTFQDIGNICKPIISDIGNTMKEFGEQIMPIITDAVKKMAPVISSLLKAIVPTLLNIAQSILPLILDTISALIPFLSNIATAIIPVITNAINILEPIITNLLNQIVPVITNLVQQLLPVISEIIEALCPIVFQLLEAIAPVLTEIVNGLMGILNPLMQLIEQILPPIQEIINVIIGLIEKIIPTITKVIESVMKVLSPIIEMVGEIIGKIVEIVSPIVTFIAEIVGDIVEFISPILEVVINIISSIIEAIKPIVDVISSIMGTIFDTIGGVIDGIMKTFGGLIDFFTGVFSGNWEQAWQGICDFFGGIWDGIWSIVKGVVNLIIDGINLLWSGIYQVVKGIVDSIGGIAGAIGDMFGQDWHFSMPENAPMIPKLAHGTDNWHGGLTYINERGRGELVNLPNGTQVIPHDISVQYAKEAARASTNETYFIDYDYLISGIANAMSNVNVHHTSTLDGKTVSETTSPLIDGDLGTAAMLQRRYA